MSDFPFVPKHEQPDAFADGVIDEAEASEAAHTLAVAKRVASEAGRELRAHQLQEEQEQATEEVVPDSGDQAIPVEADETVVAKPAAKKPAAKKPSPKKSVRKSSK